MKGKSEPMFREALGKVDLSLVIYKPPDDSRNWKPCDFMVWWRSEIVETAWFEVKEARSGTTFPVEKELRPAQRSGILDAAAIGFPYWLAIWWPERSVWSISRAIRVIDAKTLTFGELAGKYGLDAPQRSLPGTLRAILEGEELT